MSRPPAIYIILLVFIILGTLYASITPPFEASDELWHYPMVKYIADHWALPVQDPQNVGPWRQEGSQAPLYYFVGAAATFWIDTSDMGSVRRLNPHANNGIATADGNVNLITHDPQAEAFPWRGTTLAVHIIRFLSVGLGAITVYLTYRLALALLPNQPRLALGAAAINAFTPMFVFISGAVNNDNLVVPLCSWALLLVVRILQDAPRRYASRFASLGVVVGLALLTKESAGGLVLLTALLVAFVAWRRRSIWAFFVGGLASGLPTLLIAGWWYWRNWRLYGDPLGQNVFIEILGQRDVPADLAQLWRERISFVRGYWGNFGGLNVPMAEWAYTAFDLVTLAAIVGLVIALLWRLRTARSWAKRTRTAVWLFVLLWPLTVFVLWITWAATTWSSQGRLVFSAISVWSMLLALGWYAPFRLWRGLESRARLVPLVCVATFMLGVSVAAPWLWIRPAYARPPRLTQLQIEAISQRVDAVFFHPAGGQIKLLGYDAPVSRVFPGQSLPITLYWEALQSFDKLRTGPFTQDYSVFVHLTDQHDLVIAQRDALPGMGLLSTQWLEPGQRWSERRLLTLPDTAYSPNQAVFEVGLYQHSSGVRLEAVDVGGQIVGDHLRFGRVEVLARPGDWPNPISIDFGGQMELLGYDLDTRALRVGETATLTLYWRGQRTIQDNYAISTQFVDEFGRKAAQKDSWPLDGAAPTSLWTPGEMLTETRELTILETPSGVYDVYVTVYLAGDPDARLVVTPVGGRLQTDHVVLTSVRVLP